MPVIAVIGLLASAVFAPDVHARGERSSGPAKVHLGEAANYKILAGAAITAPGTQIYGSIGAEAAITIPGANITGSIEAGAALTPAIMGNTYSNNVPAALGDLRVAYEEARAVTASNSISITTTLSGRTLKAGVYNAPGALSVDGSTNHLTLDGEHNSANVWIFQAPSLAVAAGRRIILINSADVNNVFWVIDGAVTIGAAAVMRGIIISKAAITIGAYSEIHGALLSVDAAVTTDRAIII
jgi:hypothetical protein